LEQYKPTRFNRPRPPGPRPTGENPLHTWCHVQWCRHPQTAATHRLSPRPRSSISVAHRFTGRVCPCAHCHGLFPYYSPSMKQNNLPPLRAPRSLIRFLCSAPPPHRLLYRRCAPASHRDNRRSSRLRCLSSSSSHDFIREPPR
jgi:hypothetical protein